MNLLSSALAAALKMTKSSAQLDAMLLHAVTADRRILIEAALKAGANIHGSEDRALRSATFSGNAHLTSLLLKYYSLPADRIVLADIRRRAARFGHDAIDRAMSRALYLG